jgi:hypothetical protein
MMLCELAQYSLRRLGVGKVMIFEGQKFTNGQVLDQANRLQGAFAKLGLDKNELAIMCMANHPTLQVR